MCTYQFIISYLATVCSRHVDFHCCHWRGIFNVLQGTKQKDIGTSTTTVDLFYSYSIPTKVGGVYCNIFFIYSKVNVISGRYQLLFQLQIWDLAMDIPMSNSHQMFNFMDIGDDVGNFQLESCSLGQWGAICEWLDIVFTYGPNNALI